MKKLILLSILLIVSGCFVPKRPVSIIKEESSFYAVDFTKYTETGFLFTPLKYEADYESIGLISFYFYPRAVSKKLSAAQKERSGTLFMYEWRVDDIKKTDKILDEVYNKCIKMGANALTQMSISDAIKTYPNTGTQAPSLTIKGLKIEGYAIKRLGAFK